MTIKLITIKVQPLKKISVNFAVGLVPRININMAKNIQKELMKNNNNVLFKALSPSNLIETRKSMVYSPAGITIGGIENK